LPPLSIPELPNKPSYTNDEIEALAIACRRAWGLSDGPIANVVALLESKGFIVVRSEFGVMDTDAFSCIQDGRPYIFLSDDKGCAVRSRFDVSHELGHIILHSHMTQDQIEDP